MTPFDYVRASDTEEALAGRGADAAFVAGGTDLLQLMRDRIVAPGRLVDISGLPLDRVVDGSAMLEIGATVRLADAARNPAIRQKAPAVAMALAETASAQVRNMATIGGNLLQRTRCLYFRDATAPCNKRDPGAGCGAYDGCSRVNAIFAGSEQCIAAHASDLAVALTALDAELELQGPAGRRRLPVAGFYRLPGDTPQIETVLEPGELIVAVRIPQGEAARRSVFVKLRDRETFEWALASCAVALGLDGRTVRSARIVAGAVAPVPWRLPVLEEAIVGRTLDDATIDNVAWQAASGAEPRPGNVFKTQLLCGAVARALREGGGR